MLEKYRQEIDYIDDEIISLFIKRMQKVVKISAYKKQHQIPILDSNRETEIITRISAKAGKDFALYAEKLFKTILQLSKEYQNGPIKVGLLGETLVHSFSQKIYHDFFGMDYELFNIPKKDLKAFMIAKNFTGINVTVPYKKTVIPYCNVLSPLANRIGCVNIILKDNTGILYGDNTDYFGFAYMVKTANISFERKKILILGSGGTYLTVKTFAEDMKAKEIVCVSRYGKNNYNNLHIHKNADIIINTTPVGMFPNINTAPIDIEFFPNLSGVFDVIYNPNPTQLISKAKELKIPCAGGISMLAAQAVKSAELFLKTTFKDEKIAEILNNKWS